MEVEKAGIIYRFLDKEGTQSIYRLIREMLSVIMKTMLFN